METKEIISCKKALKIFLNYAWKVLCGISIIVTIIAIIIQNPSITFITIYIVGVLVLTIIVSLILVINNLVKREIADKTNLDVPALLYDVLKRTTEEEYATLRRGIDRYLHLYGHPDMRTKIVNLGKDKNIEDKIISLIDNLGWANYQSGKYKEAAIECIKTGVQMAVDNQLFYYAAKGERHLSGIAMHFNNTTACKAHLDQSEEYTKQIPEAIEKIEMQGSIYFAKAKLFLEESNFEEAEKYANLAFEKFKNDLSRQVKIYAVKGNIYFKNKNYPKARTMFFDGYKASKNIRKDEWAKNAFGLAKIYNEPESGMTSKTEAIKFAKESVEIGKNALKRHEFTEMENFYNGLK